MQPGGGDDLLVRTRTVLLDALAALAAHRDSVVVVGAQAVYLHTGDAPTAVAGPPRTVISPSTRGRWDRNLWWTRSCTTPVSSSTRPRSSRGRG